MKKGFIPKLQISLLALLVFALPTRAQPARSAVGQAMASLDAADAKDFVAQNDALAVFKGSVEKGNFTQDSLTEILILGAKIIEKNPNNDSAVGALLNDYVWTSSAALAETCLSKRIAKHYRKLIRDARKTAAATAEQGNG